MRQAPTCGAKREATAGGACVCTAGYVGADSTSPIHNSDPCVVALVSPLIFFLSGALFSFFARLATWGPTRPRPCTTLMQAWWRWCVRRSSFLSGAFFFLVSYLR